MWRSRWRAGLRRVVLRSSSVFSEGIEQIWVRVLEQLCERVHLCVRTAVKSTETKQIFVAPCRRSPICPPDGLSLRRRFVDSARAQFCTPSTSSTESRVHVYSCSRPIAIPKMSSLASSYQMVKNLGPSLCSVQFGKSNRHRADSVVHPTQARDGEHHVHVATESQSCFAAAAASI